MLVSLILLMLGMTVVRRQLDIVGEVVGESLLEMNDDEMCIYGTRIEKFL